MPDLPFDAATAVPMVGVVLMTKGRRSQEPHRVTASRQQRHDRFYERRIDRLDALAEAIADLYGSTRTKRLVDKREPPTASVACAAYHLPDWLLADVNPRSMFVTSNPE